MYTTERFWCGTDETLASYLMGMKHIEATKPQASDYGDDEDEDSRPPRLFSQIGGVGVISIAGPLVNSDSWINEYVGRTGYPEIREALIYAATKEGVGAIVLDINSGGGSVSGVSDTAELIKRIDTEMVPVHTFSDSIIASAAYWLGSSARTMSIGQVAEAGSIGVLAVHKEFTKALEMEGVKATVMRAGEFKALGSPYEKFSDKAQQDLQGQLDYLGQMFTQHVADARGVPYPTADSTMGQGRVFIGQQAVAVGLVDSVTSFDAVISKAQAEIDSQKNVPQYGANIQKGNPLKIALTTQQIAAMAEAGLPVDALTAPVAAAPAVAPVAEAPVADATKVTADPTITATLESKGDSDIVAFLKSSLAEAQAANTELTMQVRDMKASTSDMAATHEQFRSIVMTSTDRLRVAMSLPAGVHAGNDTALLADHASLRTQFESQFKAGGVAAVSSSGSSDNVSAEAVDPVRQARLASTRPAK